MVRAVLCQEYRRVDVPSAAGGAVACLRVVVIVAVVALATRDEARGAAVRSAISSGSSREVSDADNARVLAADASVIGRGAENAWSNVPVHAVSVGELGVGADAHAVCARVAAVHEIRSCRIALELVARRVPLGGVQGLAMDEAPGHGDMVLRDCVWRCERRRRWRRGGKLAAHCHRRAGGLWLRCRICRCDADGEQDSGERGDGACARAGVKPIVIQHLMRNFGCVTL